METRIEISVDKMVDRGPKYGFIEVQVTFEEKATPSAGIGLAYGVVPLPKAEVGSRSFDEVRAMALSKALSFMRTCLKGSGT